MATSGPPTSGPLGGSITQELLQTAGFYPPTVYDLLTRYASLATKTDDLSVQYIGTTDVRPLAASQTLPFVIGLLPPSLSGQLSTQVSIAENAISNAASVTPVTGDVTGDVPFPSSWNNQGGSSSAQSAGFQLASTAQTALVSPPLTQAYMQQQQAQIKDLTSRITTMQNTPPLRLLVNPRSFKNSLEKITADGNWGRSGPIIEHWGEAQDKIEGAGKIAAFYAIDTNPPGVNNGGSASAGPGLSRMTRNYSTSYQNLLSLYLLYRSNAGIFTQDYINPTTPTNTYVNLATLGSIYIYYDNILYVGSFDNFNITESDEAPFSLEYTFAFTVRAWFELDTQQNPQNLFQPPVNATTKPGIQPQPGTIPDNSGIGLTPGTSPAEQAAAQQALGEAEAEQIAAQLAAGQGAVGPTGPSIRTPKG
jgi:hypothetical protein